ncbi:sigma-70 family RNA polymerase sigma factor [Candidatus Woesearchaeota archaeon]|nr:sigma-70 family RNA polymerase sigma factor [Candidatus Woesearchaeota archaeon]
MDLFALYKKDLSEYGLLTSKEEQELARQYRDPELDPDQQRQARDKLIVSNMPLVINIAKRYLPSSRMFFLDKVSAGTFGLFTAVEKFEPKRQTKFSTYATPWIKQAIRMENLNYRTVYLPEYLSSEMARIARYEDEVLTATGIPATDDQIIAFLAQKSSKKGKKAAASRLNSVKRARTSEYVPDESSLTPGSPEVEYEGSPFDAIEGKELPPVDAMEREEFLGRIREATGRLSDVEWSIVHDYVLAEHRDKAIGARLGKERQTVSFHKRKGLRKMAETLADLASA